MGVTLILWQEEHCYGREIVILGVHLWPSRLECITFPVVESLCLGSQWHAPLSHPLLVVHCNFEGNYVWQS